MPEKRCYYEILEIHREATETEIKNSYRKMALKYHPDRNPGDPEAEDKFKEASEAYEVLRDEEKRRIYDQFGHEGLSGRGYQGFSGFDDIFSSFGDIFEEFFGFGGGRRGRPQAARGQDLRYDLGLDFKEAAFGVEKEIEVRKRDRCITCNGQGTATGAAPEPCRYCGGAGQVTRSQGFFTVRTGCPYCHGEGKVVADPCPECRGSGLTPVKKKVSVRIPAGVDSGSRLRLTGEGEAAPRGGLPGDLYVFLTVRPHDFFHRDGNDVVCQVPISFVQASLGDELTVPTLSGELKVEIPKGIQSGEVITLRNEGIPSLRTGRRGDQIIQVIVKTPTSLSKKQEALLQEFAALEEKKFSTKLKKILGKTG